MKKDLDRKVILHLLRRQKLVQCHICRRHDARVGHNRFGQGWALGEARPRDGGGDGKGKGKAATRGKGDESLKAEELYELLSTYFEEMSRIITDRSVPRFV